MNITPINLFSPIKNYKKNRLNNRFILPCDSVSFSGKKETIDSASQNIKKGIEIGKKLLELAENDSLDIKTLSKLLNKNSPIPIEVIGDIFTDKIGDNKIIASTIMETDKDNKPTVAHIFISEPPKAPEEKSYYAATAAHEFTHALQGAKDNDFQGISKYTDNPDEMAHIAFKAKETLNEMLDSCFKQIPEDKNIREKLRKQILNNEFDIEKYAQKTDLNEILDYHSFWCAGDLNRIPNDIKNVIKNWIIKETQKEIEAYTVTLDILERSTYNPKIKINWLLNKELYSFVNKSLKEQN